MPEPSSRQVWTVPVRHPATVLVLETHRPVLHIRTSSSLDPRGRSRSAAPASRDARCLQTSSVRGPTVPAVPAQPEHI